MGANANAVNLVSCTPLFYSQSEAIMSELLRFGADVDHISKSGCNALHYVVRLDNIKLVSMLLNNAATPDVRNSKGMTPLHIACSLGYSQTAETLLSFGKQNEANMKQIRRKRRCSVAVHREKRKSMQQAIADRLGSGERPQPEEPDVSKPIEKRDENIKVETVKEETSALNLAVRNRHLNILRLLLSNGQAFSSDELISLPWLIIDGANPTERKEESETDIQILEVMCNMGANVNYSYENGSTLLHRATEKRMVSLSEFAY